MTPTDEHRYSSFALDSYWYAGESSDPELAAHLATCARCRAYVDHLAGLAASPRHVARRDGAVPTPLRPVRGRFTARVVGALALAAGIAFFILRGKESAKENGDYVGVKGTPAVQVLVRHEETTAVWDGVSPVASGDALAFQLECHGLTHVTVAVREAKVGLFRRVSEAECPASRAPLPFTLVVDSEPTDDEVAVIMSRAPLDEGRLSESIARETRTRDLWSFRWVFGKSKTETR